MTHEPDAVPRHSARRRQRLASWLPWLGLFCLAVAGLTPAHAETTTYIVSNAQGTVVATMDRDGNVTYTADYRPYYRPYGKQDPGTARPGPGYTGHVNDPATGLVYMQQRYYDPAIGRFLSPDPVGPTPGNIFNFGRYTYANNNPYLYTDPNGRIATRYRRNRDHHSHRSQGLTCRLKPACRFVLTSSDDNNGNSSESPSDHRAERSELPPPFVPPPAKLQPGIKKIKPPIVKLKPSRPLIKTMDDILSKQLVKKLTKGFGAINKYGKFSPNPVGAFITLILYSPSTGGCDEKGRCADETWWRKPNSGENNK